jgi:hypothetical protein
MNEVMKIVGILVVGTFAVASLRLLLDMIRTGVSRVREAREEGSGISQKWRGELAGGQRKPSTARAHGLHMTVRGGTVYYREKSVMAKEVA